MPEADARMLNMVIHLIRPTPARGSTELTEVRDVTFTDQSRSLVPRCSYLVFRKRTMLHRSTYSRP